jgi:hypothetical protein
MDIIFASFAAKKEDMFSNYLLANSIRDFAGNLSDIPLHIYVASDLDIQDEMEKFSGLNVKFAEYPATKKEIEYAFKSAAAKACEKDVKTGNVFWMDRHMLVLNPCMDLLLDSTEQFGCHPPQFKLLGASVDEPINQLWETVYKIAEVSKSDLFPMYTKIDRKKIWAYFNAGHFSFHAEAGMMSAWDDLFNQLLEHEEMKPLLDDSSFDVDGETIRIFLHQIALTVTVLKMQKRSDLKLLPRLYGYETGFHDHIEKCYQASQMDQVQTAFFTYNNSGRGSGRDMPMSEMLSSWIEDKAKQFWQDEER